MLVALSFGVVGFGSSGLASRDSDDLEPKGSMYPYSIYLGLKGVPF